MSQIPFVSVFPQLGRTFLDADGVVITAAGAIVDRTTYIQNALDAGYLRTNDPLGVNQPVDRRTLALSSFFEVFTWAAPRGTSGSQLTRFVVCEVGVPPSVAASDSNAVPGNAAILLIPPITFSSLPEDAPYSMPTARNVWCTTAIEREKARWTAWIEGYIAAGGKTPERIAMDQESLTSTYNIASDAEFLAIWNDPRGGQLRAEMAARYGIVDPQRQILDVPENSAVGARYGDYGPAFRYNAVVIMLQDAALREAYFGVARRFWPGVKFSNYGDHDASEYELSWVRAPNARMEFTLGPIFGSHCAPEIYGLWTPQAESLYFMTNSTFSVFVYSVNRLRSMYRSNPTLPSTPWVSYGFEAPLSDNPVFARELLYHLALCGADGLSYFNASATLADDEATAAVVAAIRARLNTSNRECVTLERSFAVPWLVSGMRVGQQYHWRITATSQFVPYLVVNGVNTPLEPGTPGLWLVTSTPEVPTVALP